jgi:peptidoglycan/xylan/chitin deacetylase (PgdA/CDA1 family)
MPNMFTKTLGLYQLTLLLLAVIFVLVSCNGTPANTKNADSSNTIQTGTVTATLPEKDKNDRAVITAVSNDDVYDSTKKYIYLTFDDGPQLGTTACLHTIEQLGVKATFFMIGMHQWDAFLKRVVDSINNNYPAILLANHSFTHAFRDKYRYFYTHPHAALADFNKAQDSLHVPYKIVRLPGNSSWVRNGVIRAGKLTKPVCVLLDSAGYKVMGWDIEWNFRPEPGGAKPVQNVETMVKLVENTLQKNECYKKNNLVLLAHDRMFHTPAYTDSLYKFVSVLKQNPHYVFETVDKYPMQQQPSKL